MSLPDPSSEHELHYASPPPLHRRRIVARSLIILGVVLALLLSSRWAPPLWRRATLLYWQRQCMRATPRPDIVVFAKPANDQNGWNSVPRGVAVEHAWDQFHDRLMLTSQSKSCGTIFLREMSSHAGHHRIVAINAFNFFAPFPGIVCESQVFQPGTLFSEPREMLNGDRAWFGAENASCIFGASPDPNDPSHFTFQIEKQTLFVSRLHTVDGWLTDDDQIVLEIRNDASLTPPAPPSTASSP